MADSSNSGGSPSTGGSISSTMGAYKGNGVPSTKASTNLGGNSSGQLMTPTDLSVDLNEYTENETESFAINSNNIDEVVQEATSSVVVKGCNTADMFVLALNDGAIGLTEKIGDGAIWSTKAIIDVYMFLGGKMLSLIDPKYEDASNELQGQVDGFFSDVIAFEADDWVHDQIAGTEYIKTKNENSYLDYNSETSKSIASVSEWIQTKVGAALSSKVWGGALAILLGGCYGSGEQAESLYKDHKNTTFNEELSILVSGINSAVEWWSVGQMFKGLTGAAKSTTGGTSMADLGKELANSAKSDLPGTHATIMESFKSYLSSAHNPFSKSLGEFMSNPTSILRINLALFSNLDEYLSGEKDVTVTSIWGDVNNSFSRMVVGGLRTNIIENADDYTALPIQGSVFALNPITLLGNWFAGEIESEITGPDEYGGGGGGHEF